MTLGRFLLAVGGAFPVLLAATALVLRADPLLLAAGVAAVAYVPAAWLLSG